MPRAHRSPRSAAAGPRQQPSRNLRRNFDANKNSGNSRAFLQHADATSRFACCRARRRRHPGACTRACPQAEKNFSRHAPFRHRTRANAQNCANFSALFGACERARAPPRTASRRRRRCRCRVRMTAHAPHRHITHMRADVSRLLWPTRRLPSACSPRAPPQHRACAPRRTHPTENARDAAGRRWPRRSERGCDRQTLRQRHPTAMHITVTARKPARPSPRPGAAAAASPSRTWRPHRAHRCLRRGRHPPPGVSHPSPASRPRAATPATQPLSRAERLIGKPADCRTRAPLPVEAFVCAAQTKTGRTRRPVRLSR